MAADEHPVPLQAYKLLEVNVMKEGSWHWNVKCAVQPLF